MVFFPTSEKKTFFYAAVLLLRRCGLGSFFFCCDETRKRAYHETREKRIKRRFVCGKLSVMCFGSETNNHFPAPSSVLVWMEKVHIVFRHQTLTAFAVFFVVDETSWNLFNIVHCELWVEQWDHECKEFLHRFKQIFSTTVFSRKSFLRLHHVDAFACGMKWVMRRSEHCGCAEKLWKN